LNSSSVTDRPPAAPEEAPEVEVVFVALEVVELEADAPEAPEVDVEFEELAGTEAAAAVESGAAAAELDAGGVEVLFVFAAPLEDAVGGEMAVPDAAVLSPAEAGGDAIWAAGGADD
jgi:hypothetical protein